MVASKTERVRPCVRRRVRGPGRRAGATASEPPPRSHRLELAISLTWLGVQLPGSVVPPTTVAMLDALLGMSLGLFASAFAHSEFSRPVHARVCAATGAAVRNHGGARPDDQPAQLAIGRTPAVICRGCHAAGRRGRGRILVQPADRDISAIVGFTGFALAGGALTLRRQARQGQHCSPALARRAPDRTPDMLGLQPAHQPEGSGEQIGHSGAAQAAMLETQLPAQSAAMRALAPTGRWSLGVICGQPGVAPDRRVCALVSVLAGAPRSGSSARPRAFGAIGARRHLPLGGLEPACHPSRMVARFLLPGRSGWRRRGGRAPGNQIASQPKDLGLGMLAR
jgi:hypothetical protein